jgi:REP element-mobilizing transposase RayT
MDSTPSSHERERVEKRHLPRLAPAAYRGFACIHWTLTLDHRDTGWLTATFHHTWQLTLLHTCSRYDLLCPVYVLMPDHAHLLWLGLDEQNSDQRTAMEFLRKHLRSSLSPARWQHQVHDHVLREDERASGVFQTVAHYILDNPVRAGLIQDWTNYPFSGCCIPGYPDLHLPQSDYWEKFWRIRNRLVENSI